MPKFDFAKARGPGVGGFRAIMPKESKTRGVAGRLGALGQWNPGGLKRAARHQRDSTT